MGNKLKSIECKRAMVAKKWVDYSRPLIEDFKAIVVYLEMDEKRHYEELGRPKNHIYRSVVKLKKFIALIENFVGKP